VAASDLVLVPALDEFKFKIFSDARWSTETSSCTRVGMMLMLDASFKDKMCFSLKTKNTSVFLRQF
jgi:hypothetical protein